MHNISDRDVNMFKRIYSYITPLIIIDEEHKKYIKENSKLDVFRLIENMRNTPCHHILVKEMEIGNNIKGNYIEELFINMVKLYQVFDLDLTKELTDKLTDKLTKKFKLIKYLWNKIPDDKKIFKLCVTGNEKQIKDDEVEKIKEERHKDFYNYFKELLHLLHGDGNGDGLFLNYGEGNKTKIKTIYRYVAPIIVWYKDVEEHFKENHADDLLFKIIFYTRHSVCHVNKNMPDEEDLKQIMQNMNIVYRAFGIDLSKEQKEVSDILKDEPFTSKFVKSVKEKIQVNNTTKCIKKDGSEIIGEIRNILCNKDDPVNDEYFLFGNYLHYSVSTKITNGPKFTQVFTNDDNIIKWNNEEERFIEISKENKIIKFASPFFVWIQVLDNIIQPIEFDRNQQFYLSVKEIRINIIEYLKKKKVDSGQKYNILQEMKLFYEPIENYYNKINKSNFSRDIHFYDLFVKLVDHYLIGRKQQKFSHSFIFNYYHNRNDVTNIIKNEAKKFDIFNFCGVFYIFVKWFENDPTVNNCEFYKKTKEITDLITRFMIQEIRDKHEYNGNLQNKIIDEMKSTFQNIKSYHKDFLQIYNNVVTSRGSVQTCSIKSEDEIDASDYGLNILFEE